MHVNRQIEIDWMLENYRKSKHYTDHIAAYEADKNSRKAILDELTERQSEWNIGTIQQRKAARQRLVKEIQGRDEE